MMQVFILVVLSLFFCRNTLAQTCPVNSSVSPSSIARARPNAFPNIQKYIVEQASVGPYDSFAIGDSIIMRWPRVILEAALGSPLLNAGIGGDGASDVIYRLTNNDWTHVRPKRVLLLIGTNDTWLPPCEVLAGVKAAAMILRHTFPLANMGVVSILPRGPNLLARNAQITTANLGLQEAAKVMHFTFIDAYSSFVSACHHRTPCGLFVKDNLHPSVAGYVVLAQVIRRSMNTLDPPN